MHKTVNFVKYTFIFYTYFNFSGNVFEIYEYSNLVAFVINPCLQKLWPVIIYCKIIIGISE